MRLLSIAVLSICVAQAQVYNIKTAAGGGLPENTPCTAADLHDGIGGFAADAAGDLFIPIPQVNIVVRCDASTAVLTRVAGTGAAGFSDGQNVPSTSVRVTAPMAVAVDPSGNLYIAERARVRKVSQKGIITTVAGNGIAGFSGDGGPASGAEIDTVAIAADALGNVYISDASGRVRKVSNGIITTIAGAGAGAGATGDNVPATSARIGAPPSIAVDAAGNLYLASYNGGVRKISNGIITTVTSAVRANAITVDASGNLYIVGPNAIYEFSGGAITRLAGAGTAVGDNIPAVSALVYFPQSVAVDSSGNVYYSDVVYYSDSYDQNNAPHLRVRKISRGSVTTVAGGSYKDSENGPPTAAQLVGPFGVAVDAAGNLYFSERFGNRIRKVSNGVLTTIAGNGTAGFSGDGGPATAAQLSDPTAIAVDSQGAVYIADTGNQRIREVANGVITTVAGNGTKGNSGDGGPAISAQFFNPIGLAVDAAGTLYITDSDNDRIRKVSNGIINAAAGDGKYGYLGENVPATSAQFKYPEGLTVDGAGNLYLADFFNNYVRKVATNGIMNTVAGLGDATGDGIPAKGAALRGPTALAADPSGNLYIGDQGRISKVTNGLIYPIAGDLPLPSDASAASGTPAGRMLGMAADSEGRIYFSDSAHQSIRVLVPQTGSAVSITAVLNAASNLQSWIAPGEIVVLTGSGLGPADLNLGKLTADGVYDTQIAGSSVQINGVPAPMIYASAHQVAAVVPYRAILTGPPYLNQITVTYQGSVSKTVKIAGAQWALGLFTSDGTGAGQAAAVNQDGMLNGVSHPAAPGSVISLYATGEGVTMPVGTDGKPASAPLPIPVTPISVTIGGQTVNPEYVAGAPGQIAGMMQINVRIPRNIAPENAVPVTVEAPGYAISQSGVTIAVGK